MTERTYGFLIGVMASGLTVILLILPYVVSQWRKP